MKKFIEKYWWCGILMVIISLSIFLNKEDSDKYLEFATWGTLEEFESYSKLVNLYNSKNPPYPVKLIHISGEYEQKILVMAAAKNTPDVIKTFNGLLRNFYHNNIIEDLTKYIKADTSFNINAFYPKLIKMVQIDSLYVAIPIVFSTLVLYYNKNHFDVENLPYPDSTWTWDDLLYAAKRLTKQNEAGEIVRYGCYIEIFKSTMIKQWGGHHFNETRDSSITATPESAEALQFFIDLEKKHKVTIDPMRGGFRVDEIFSSERTSMLINGRWATPWFVKTMRKGSFDVAPVPHKKERMTGLAAHYVVMSSTTKKKDAAWDFIKFLVSKESQVLTSEDGNNIPAMKSVAESDKFLKNKNTPDINNQVFLNELDHATEWFFEECAYLNPTFVQRNFDITRDKASYGFLTPIQALKEHDDKMNLIIATEKQKKIPKQFWGSGLFFICLFIFLIAVIGLNKRKKNQ